MLDGPRLPYVSSPSAAEQLHGQHAHAIDRLRKRHRPTVTPADGYWIASGTVPSGAGEHLLEDVDWISLTGCVLNDDNVPIPSGDPSIVRVQATIAGEGGSAGVQMFDATGGVSAALGLSFHDPDPYWASAQLEAVVVDAVVITYVCVATTGASQVTYRGSRIA